MPQKIYKMKEETKKTKKTFSRRKFLVRSGVGIAGAMALLYFGRSPIRRGIASFEYDLPSGVSDFSTDMWFEINEDNSITLKSPKIEMGQGIFTGFAMLAAEELDIPLDKIKVILGTTKTGAGDFAGTGGSSSTSSLYKGIREVAATLRETLKLAAAKKWNLKPADIKTKDGLLSAGNKSITYAELSKQTKEWEAAKTPELRPASTFKYVGTNQKRIDLKDKVLAKPIYGIDIDLPNMVYGAVLYCPFISGKLKSADVAEAKKSAGVLKVLEEKDWIGVVATSRYAAELAIGKIKPVWDIEKKYSSKDIEKLITVGSGNEVNVQKEGDVSDFLAENNPNSLMAEYRTPLGAHASMEPNVVVADVQADKAVIYIAFQKGNGPQSSVAGALGLDAEKVEIEPMTIGGSFGRKFGKHSAVEAALLSKAIGKPVHLVLTRQQEFQNGYLRPNTHHKLLGKLDENGKLIAMQHEQATGDMILLGMGAMAMKVLGADFISAGHGSRIPYSIENKKATMWQGTLPFRTGIWRAVGMFSNTFAIESFIDEMAHKAKKDPFDFRLEHLDKEDELLKRRADILKIVTEKSGWTTPKPEGIGRGIASGEDRKSICAAVVEVKIIDGKIVVTKVTQIIDAGKIINPEGVRQQVEGATMMALSAALFEEITIVDGAFEQTNFHNYTVAKLTDTPDIEVIIHEGSEQPYGVGEPPMSPIAPAIANAIFDLTGKRLRELPLQLAFEKA
jgi:isoquinoline 1-oxidoreductase subunit beta